MLQIRPRILRHDLLVALLLLSTFTAPLSYCSRTTFDYGEALSKSLLYFESQRSGRLPYSQRVTWRSDSGLNDGLEQGVDLVGGYYDAGDNVKFGLPMAFTITMLSWGVIEYRQQIADAGELQHALEAIKWGTDYFIKSHTHPNVLWAQVGDGYTDHYCWQRPEDMTTSRQAYKVDQDNPGSDIAGETAAAMAAASIVFRKTNPHYSHLLLHHAKQLLDFGDKYRGKYDDSVRVSKGYYPSVSGYGDELLWAALWLYRATDSNTTPKKKTDHPLRNNNFYFNYVLENATPLGGITWNMSEFSWDVKYSGLQLIASMLLKEGNYDDQQRRVLEEYRSKGELYVCACLNLNRDNDTNVRRTPGGLLYIRKWNNMQYVSNAAFLLTVYGDHLKSTNETVTCGSGSGDNNKITVYPQDILNFARSQVDYILGDNPMEMSYLVGFGARYPLRMHHRGGSIESYRNNRGFIGCTQGYDYWYGRDKPNPNVVTGALVGGPDESDRFLDDRGNFVQTEACTYNTATLVGVFARWSGLEEKRIVSGVRQIPFVDNA